MSEKDREKAREKGRYYYQKNKKKLLTRQKRICKIAKKYRCTCRKFKKVI